jgi:hypothetical protein
MAQELIAPPSQDFLQKTLGAALDEGVTASATLNNVTGIQNLKGVMIVDRVDANGEETGRKEVVTFEGTSGSTVITLVRGRAGTSDQDHPINAVVEFSPDVLWAQAVYDGLAEILDPNTGLVDPTNVVTPAAPVFILGSDARGDMYYRGNGASLSRLPIGAAGSILEATASLPKWSNRGVQSPFVDFAVGATQMYMDYAVANKWRATVVPDVAASFFATNATLGYIGMLRIKYASTASLAINFMSAGATISWANAATLSPTATLNKADVIGMAVSATHPKFDLTIIGQNYTD